MNELIVGVDASDGAKRALDWAVKEAQLRDEPLTVVHVRPSFGLLLSESMLPEDELWRVEEAATNRAESVIDDFVDATVHERITVKQEIIDESPVARVLIDRAAGSSALIVGGRGRGGFGRLLMGSVSQQVAQHARCPVVVVPAGYDPTASRKPRVIVGVDGSPGAVRALDRAAEEARIRGAALHVVMVQPRPRPPEEFGRSQAGLPSTGWVGVPPLHVGAPPEERARRHDEFLRTWQAGGDAVIDRALEHLGPDRQPSDIDRTVAPDDHPAHALLTYAEDAELLVVGARGLGGFAGLLLGSVSNQCVQHATSPVMVVRPPAE